MVYYKKSIMIKHNSIGTFNELDFPFNQLLTGEIKIYMLKAMVTQ